jgi:RHS repeat-associated protein
VWYWRNDPCESGFSGADPGYAGIYLHARYFDPKLGTFLSPDPIGVEGGTNLYAYVLGNPVNGTDRSGLLKDPCVEGGDIDPGCRPFVSSPLMGLGMGEFLSVITGPSGGILSPTLTAAVAEHERQLALEEHGTVWTIYNEHGTPIGMTLDPRSANEDLCRANSAACRGGRILTNIYGSEETGVILTVGTRDVRQQIADVTVGQYGGGAGHTGLAVGDDAPVGYYPAEQHSKGYFMAGNSSPGIVRGENSTPVDSVTLHTTPQQDAAVRALIRAYQRDPRDYNLYTNNCAQVTSDILRAAGINIPRAWNPVLLLEILRLVNTQ